MLVVTVEYQMHLLYPKMRGGSHLQVCLVFQDLSCLSCQTFKDSLNLSLSEQILDNLTFQNCRTLQFRVSVESDIHFGRTVKFRV